MKHALFVVAALGGIIPALRSKALAAISKEHERIQEELDELDAKLHTEK